METSSIATALPASVPTQSLIGGQWVDCSGDTVAIDNPATGEALCTVRVSQGGDLEKALDSVHRGESEWQALGAWERSEILRQIASTMRVEADEFALVMTLEQGKPLAQSRAEVLASADQFDWMADEARRVYGRIVPAKNATDEIYVFKEPVGPIATFAPWNFPSLLPARKIAAGLAAGCSVLVIPAIEAPLSALLIARAALASGVPGGALTALLANPAEVSEQIITDARIRKVSITSSVPVGQQVMASAAQSITPVTLELGGHSPVIVTADVDVAEVAKVCAAGKFRNAGQVCISASRFFVHEAIRDQFIEEFTSHTQGLSIGPGTEAGVDVGPLSTKRRLDAIQDLVDDATSQGAGLVSGGKRLSSFSEGYFFEPTVLVEPSANSRVMQEETFGPIAPIAGYSDLEEAITRANQTPYGLAGFVFSQDLRTSLDIAKSLEAGMVGINNLTIATAEAPFGGVKMSGFGREGALEGIEEFLQTKYVNVRAPLGSADV